MAYALLLSHSARDNPMPRLCPSPTGQSPGESVRHCTDSRGASWHSFSVIENDSSMRPKQKSAITAVAIALAQLAAASNATADAEIRHSGSIIWTSGGISEEGRDQLSAVARS